jgi:hypothetical protein
MKHSSFCVSIRFCLNIRLSTGKKEAVKDLKILACWIIIYWNDYYSYGRENVESLNRAKDSTDESILVLMSQYEPNRGGQKLDCN